MVGADVVALLAKLVAIAWANVIKLLTLDDIFKTAIPRAAMATALVLWRFATLYCPLMLGALGFIALACRRCATTPAPAPD